MNKATPTDGGNCSLDPAQPTNKCPFVFCKNDNECESMFCYYYERQDANGICAPVDVKGNGPACTRNASATFNRCEGVACDRDSQCSDGICGDTGHNGTCVNYHDDDFYDGDGTSDVIVVIVAVVVIALAVFGAWTFCWKKKKAAQEESQKSALISETPDDDEEDKHDSKGI